MTFIFNSSDKTLLRQDTRLPVRAARRQAFQSNSVNACSKSRRIHQYIALCKVNENEYSDSAVLQKFAEPLQYLEQHRIK